MRRIVEVRPRLKKLLKEKGIKQKELSRLTGIAEPTLSRFDKQNGHEAKTKFILRDALGLNSTDELFEVVYAEKE